MARKRKAVGAGKRRVRRKRVGGSAFGDFFTKGIPNFFTKTIPNAARSTGKFIKDQHVLSSLAGLAGSIIPHPAGKVAGLLGSAALRQAGLGKRRRKRRVGGSLMSTVKSMDAYMKKHRLPSKMLAQIPDPRAIKAATAAHVMGYGRVRRPRKMHGGLSSLNGRLFLL